jgi:hypothetical protein
MNYSSFPEQHPLEERRGGAVPIRFRARGSV